jgi:hypothetical protein
MDGDTQAWEYKNTDRQTAQQPVAPVARARQGVTGHVILLRPHLDLARTKKSFPIPKNPGRRLDPAARRRSYSSHQN